MRRLVQEKERAINLRKGGMSYTDILSEVKVAKSTLSLWLKDLPLTDQEKFYLKGRKDDNISKGRIRAATSNRMRKVVRDGFLLRDAKREFEQKSKDPLFHLGIALYWAEGSKRSNSFAFTNSDPDMVRIMVGWIRRFLEVEEGEMGLRLYIHKPYAHENCEAYWLQVTELPVSSLKRTIYKPTSLLIKKRPGYKGCVRIELGRVRHLLRLKFWQQMLIEQYGKAG